MSNYKKQQQYASEFKESAVKLAIESDQPITKTAEELGVNKNTLHTWISKLHHTSMDGAKKYSIF
jgi:transposase